MANPRMTAEIGRVLGGRYRLVAPIGMGASAQVYLADDVRLRRRVALKMLHDALAEDAEFLRRFRAEARAAAALSHPNVMAVYDWGDDEVAFIVTEYLGGGSLRALLDRGEVLTPSQALAVGLEATRALDYAHRRGFVHRDIKPANLLFGEEQRLRIADFGLARALAEAAWTEPQGAMLGTARYASPEQAKGEKVNGKADVYALALVLVEAVTGEVPFAADTTIGTLMARVDRPLVVPDALGALQGVLTRAGHPDPEQRIDARTLAAGLLRAAKALPKPAPLPLAGALPPAGELAIDLDPTIHGPGDELRTELDLTDDDLDLDPPDWVNQAEAPAALGLAASAAALTRSSEQTSDDGAADGGDVDAGGTDQERHLDGAAASDEQADASVDVDVLDPEPVPELVHVLPAADGGDLAADDPTVDLTADDHAANEVEVEQPDAAAAAPTPVLDPAPVGAVAGSAASDPSGSVSDAPGLDASGPAADEDRPRRRRRWPWVLAVVALLAGGGGAAAWALDDPEPAPPARAVVLPIPSLVGRTQVEAAAIVTAAGWEPTVVEERRDGTRKGQVLATTPAAGTRLAKGKDLQLVVSAGQTEVDVPADLAGRSLADATAALQAVGLVAATGETRHDEDVDEGAVVGLVAGTPPKLEKGSTVNLVVSDGPEPRVVPSGLYGATEEEATALLQARQLRVAVNRQYNDDVPAGDVVSVAPKSGSSVARGTTITIEVSRGPSTVAVPSVTGAATSAEAAAILRSAGLVPGSVSGSAEGSPTGTSPSVGSVVAKGSTVNIIVG